VKVHHESHDKWKWENVRHLQETSDHGYGYGYGSSHNQRWKHNQIYTKNSLRSWSHIFT
jgi:hypothetical protein